MAPISAVWTYFTKTRTVEGGQGVRCGKCARVLKFNGSTTTMKDHWTKVHKVLLTVQKPTQVPGEKRRRNAVSSEDEDEVDNPHNAETAINSQAGPSQPRGQEVRPVPTPGPLLAHFQSAKSYAEGGKKHAEVTTALLYMIAVDNMPLRTPERKGMRMFAQKLNPLYKMPCEETTTKLHEKYETTKVKVAALIKEHKLMLTTDVWTDLMTARSFLGVTIHFREGTEIRTISLGAKPMCGTAKTIQNLKDALQEICQEWEIDMDSVLAVATDNGANIVGAVKQLFGVEKHVACLAHSINLVATKAIGLYEKQHEELPEEEKSDEEGFHEDVIPSELQSILRKVKRVVGFVRRSEAAASELKNLQIKEQNKKEGQCLKLIQEVRTRWNSLYEMVDRYLVLGELVERCLHKIARERNTRAPVPESLTFEEEATLKEVRDFLCPLWQMTMEICGEKAVTLSKVIPLVRVVRKRTDQLISAEPIAFNIKGKIINELRSRFAHLEFVPLYSTATILDPRFKTMHFSTDIARSRAINHLGELVRRQMAQAQADQDEAREDVQPVSNATLQHEARASLWEEHDKLVILQQGDVSNLQEEAGQNILELRLYLRRPVCSRNTNPLAEWELLKRDFPNLYDLAMEYLPLLATSVPSERLFSRAGLVLTKLRNRLASQKVDELLFLSGLDERFWFD